VSVPSTVPAQWAAIWFVGEAPGVDEEREGKPFVGAAGRELSKLCRDSTINRIDCGIANVFSERPDGNRVESLCGRKADMPANYSFPPLSLGHYVRPEHLHELTRLKKELSEAAPNIVIALGNTALWALCGRTGITKARGAITESTLVPGLKVLPALHPAAILRQWDFRTITVADFIKAKRESAYPDIKYPERTVYIAETLEDLAKFKAILEAARKGNQLLSVDIETMKHKYISCIGFAPAKNGALVIPFISRARPGFHYWQDEAEELEAWRLCKWILESSIHKIGQNFLYDWQYLYEAGIRVHNVTDDLMLEHHALWPELEKSLGFMGSVHTNERAWKTLRPRGDKAAKREE
jgi:DNA polymerase